jgi:hypothetical protein
MADDNKRAQGTPQKSQDALRHEKDALHHKFHGGPQPDAAAETSEAGEQPEIPKVGSRDAPGG